MIQSSRRRCSDTNAASMMTKTIVIMMVLLSVLSSTTQMMLVSAQTETCEAGDESCEVKEESPLVITCVDESEKCAAWAEEGKCNSGDYQVYMKTKCRKSCPDVCDEGTLSLGVPQDLTQGDVEQTKYTYAQSLEYVYGLLQLQDDEEQEDDWSTAIKLCKNHHASCTWWANLGECDKNPSYMKVSCAPACQTCENLDVNKRCPWDPTVDMAWKPGDLDQMFLKLTTDPQFVQQYTPTVLSKPGGDNDTTTTTDTIDGPWVITLDNFLSEEECQHLIHLGGDLGYFRSEGGTDSFDEDGRYISSVSSHRTSYQTWCLDDCYEDPITKGVTKRIEEITGITEPHFEYLQLLKYDQGQYYKSHNDFIPHHLNRPMGPRILTVYFYLSDVEEGGGTRFTSLDKTVTPKRGRAIIWPSVMNDNPFENDKRTDHEAIPVSKGQKFGCNAWLHQSDFKDAYKNDCQT